MGIEIAGLVRGENPTIGGGSLMNLLYWIRDAVPGFWSLLVLVVVYAAIWSGKVKKPSQFVYTMLGATFISFCMALLELIPYLHFLWTMSGLGIVTTIGMLYAMNRKG